ncbi:MAG TPA: UDP-N-acetylmuramoylalanyl-D-glutamyl-2,6-diaminopimelate--D-alanyl-D-alanine ligase [Xanthobacteraceae bacterium]|nr:UDP-N-acetylmuramoylalanyl-D-glutamyl-2,6-diaminopimelate--D-alanyl-D-alanine ligase [Xanthobacteraceae bacterium]
MTSDALWAVAAMADAMRAASRGSLSEAISGLSIDSRTVLPGEAYFAIKGDVHDGHDFVEAALSAGASLAVVSENWAQNYSGDAALLVVPDVLQGLRDLAVAARARLQGRVIAVTGSAGKTSTKDMLRQVLAAQGKTHASVASFNNHWGVPLTLARCPADARFAVFEIGMNHAGEIEPLVKMVRPQIAVITTVEPVHLEFFGSVEAIADAKAEIFSGIEPGGVAILNRDNGQFARLKRKAKAAGVAQVVAFGEGRSAEARLLDIALHPAGSAVHGRILGHDVTYKLGLPGRHMALNSLAVLAAVELAGADLALAALTLSQLRPGAGRGARLTLTIGDGAATLIDESYNANPAAMVAALTVLGTAPISERSRRIAVLGDMLELGPTGPDLHRGLAEAVTANGIDSVYCCGPLMNHLWDALPSSRRGGYAPSSAALESQVVAAIRAGDAIMVKGSLGSRMKVIVDALQKRFPVQPAREDVTA